MSVRRRLREQTRPMRLGPRPGEVIDRGEAVQFVWNGRALEGFRGDTIVSALAANGVSVLSRSFKYHRPRGILTASFHDPGCTVQVDDEPNVRAGHRLLAAGMDVRAQNVWPSLGLDAGAANRAVAPFIGAGFYYKTFIKPQRLWPAYEKVLQRFAPGGRVAGLGDDATHGGTGAGAHGHGAGGRSGPGTDAGARAGGHGAGGHGAAGQAAKGRYDKRYAHPDVLVAGGGPAGMAAAVEAARAGASVMLVEEEHELGGHLRYGGRADLDALAALRAEVAAEDGIEPLTDSVVSG
ncbi:MAG TPA: 2Fe-2S iron-sulfur cluster-binding protein, partial [Acidimicrobiales bacterium]|nr:2Fe-2S iron-sulfur cluster-binding protein [Acidimicrobiales bacterium]